MFNCHLDTSSEDPTEPNNASANSKAKWTVLGTRTHWLGLRYMLGGER